MDEFIKVIAIKARKSAMHYFIFQPLLLHISSISIASSTISTALFANMDTLAKQLTSLPDFPLICPCLTNHNQTNLTNLSTTLVLSLLIFSSLKYHLSSELQLKSFSLKPSDQPSIPQDILSTHTPDSKTSPPISNTITFFTKV